ncbi:pyridoxamine 5-phosphate oxidase, partial [Mycolicibacterium vanbaalenii PYR-1]|nr:pyridoxamine 5-phosphate oxidase [Mycolicibacterium vanbaalenii PYR-1]
MSKHYGSIAFTGDVRAVQSEHGSEAFYGRKLAAGKASSGRDPLTGEEKEYLSERDGLFL